MNLGTCFFVAALFVLFYGCIALAAVGFYLVYFIGSAFGFLFVFLGVIFGLLSAGALTAMIKEE